MSSFKQLYDESRAAFRDEPEKARTVFETESRLVGGFQSAVQVRQFRFHSDEPEALGGGDSAPNPVEYLLAALGTCQEVTYRLYADALGIPLRGVSVKLAGTLDLRGFLNVDDDVRPGYTAIRGTVTIDSPAGADEIERLKQAVERHCPVLDTLRNPTPVDLVVNHLPGEAAAAE